MYSRAPTAVKTHRRVGQAARRGKVRACGSRATRSSCASDGVRDLRSAADDRRSRPAGTNHVVRSGRRRLRPADRRRRRRAAHADRPWHLELRPRGHSAILSFAWPDTPYAILLLLDNDGSPRGWYVNLQTPLARTPVGFDTVDHALDVLVTLDRSSWTWKDEDELAEAIALGLFTEADAASFRSWGERAVEHLVNRRPPFDVDWEDWRPDPTWTMPELPPDWDVI